jgi:hypothetical protein
MKFARSRQTGSGCTAASADIATNVSASATTGGGHGPSYWGGGFLGATPAPFEGLHQSHVTCAFSIVAFQRRERAITWSTWLPLPASRQ